LLFHFTTIAFYFYDFLLVPRVMLVLSRSFFQDLCVFQSHNLQYFWSLQLATSFFYLYETWLARGGIYFFYCTDFPKKTRHFQVDHSNSYQTSNIKSSHKKLWWFFSHDLRQKKQRFSSIISRKFIFVIKKEFF
jgi:hypothetical protein